MFPGDNRDLHDLLPPSTEPDRFDGAFLAQLERGETPDNLTPARYATVAFRAAILAELGIDWGAELANSRRLGADRIKDLALRLAVGEIDPNWTLGQLDEGEASLTCRVGGIFLTELVRLIEATSEPIPAPPTPRDR